MKGFALDESGDVLIVDNKIQMVNGAELTRQTVQTVLGTNKGEWSLNVDEGIDFRNILGKHQNVSVSDNSKAEIYELKQKSKQETENTERLARKLAKRLDGEI